MSGGDGPAEKDMLRYRIVDGMRMRRARTMGCGAAENAGGAGSFATTESKTAGMLRSIQIWSGAGIVEMNRCVVRS